MKVLELLYTDNQIDTAHFDQSSQVAYVAKRCKFAANRAFTFSTILSLAEKSLINSQLADYQLKVTLIYYLVLC